VTAPAITQAGSLNLTPEQQTALLSQIAGELKVARAEIESAIPAMRAYASKNPKHHMGGAEQDPNGAHAWLERNDLPNAGNAP
jgi:hypothetical protein